MKRLLILSLILISMLVMSFSNVYAVGPKYNKSTEKYITNTSEYTYQRNFGFQINWYNSTAIDFANIVNITFELTRVNGTVTNYTAFTSIKVNNISNAYYINFTQEQLDRASNSTNCDSYKWYANNTDNVPNVTGVTQWCLNQSTQTQYFMNLTRRAYPLGTEYQDYETGADLTYSGPTSQNLTGWYDTRFTGQTAITFTLYQEQISKGTSNPQEATRDFTSQTETWTYNTSGNVNYTTATKDILFTYSGSGSSGGSSGSGVSTTLSNCPFECCSSGENYIEKMCSTGTCVNHDCSVTTTSIYNYETAENSLTNIYYGLPLWAWFIIGVFIVIVLIISFYYALK